MSEFASSFDAAAVKNFREFDLNDDGIITPQECLAADKDGAKYEGGSSRASAPRRSSPPPRSAAPTAFKSSPPSARPQPKLATGAQKKIDPRYLKYYRDLFAKYDANQDGALVKDEWSAMREPPEGADADGNGRITSSEFISWSTRRK